MQGHPVVGVSGEITLAASCSAPRKGTYNIDIAITESRANPQPLQPAERRQRSGGRRMPKHGCCLGSPPSGRSLVEARRSEDLSCLPKERSRSPSRTCQPSLLSVACPETDADHGPLADGLLPLAVCRAVTRVIWSAARAQAEADHAQKQGSPASQETALRIYVKDELSSATALLQLCLFIKTGRPPSAAMEDLQVGVRKAKSLQMDPQPLRAAALRLKSQVDSGRLPGVMACAVKEGTVIHFEAHGFSDLAGQVAMNSQTLFRLYSQTKPVLVIGFLILFERGEVLLDDPVEKYLPEFKDAAVGPQRKPLLRPILVRDLLAHTSGIGFGPGFGYEAENDYESTYVELVRKEWCEELAKIPLRFQPGKDWGYGYSSDVLGRLIEVLTKKRLDDFLREELLEPLGMASTFFAVPEEQAAKLAALYKREPWHGKAKTVRFVTSDVGGSGIMEDLSRNVLARPEVDKSSVHPMPTSVFLRGGPASKDGISERSSDSACPHGEVIQGGGCICSVAGGLVSNLADCSRFFQMIVNNGELDGVRLLKAATVQLLGRDWLNEFTTEKRRRPLWVWNTPGIGFSPLGQIGVKFKGANRRTVGSQLHTVHWGGAGGSGYMLNWPHRLVVLTYSGVVFDTDTQKKMWRAAFGSLRKGGARPVASAPQEESKDPWGSRDLFCLVFTSHVSMLLLPCALAIQKGKQACDTSASAFPMMLGASEPSQTQSTQPEDVPSNSEEVVRLALSTLASALAQANGWHSERLGPALCAALRKEGTTKRPLAACATGSPAEDVVLARVRTLSLCAVAYWREVSQDLGRAASSLSRFLEQQRHLYWKRPPYRGVNLGGWLLLEPGPSHELFQTFGPEATCEWRLLDKMRKHLGAQKTTEAIQAHRASFVSEEDFRNIRSMGFNAVRIPFGYWIVTGPAKGELYVGPGLDFLDRALTWCQRLGLQVLLDLHGAPGGESGEKPCGRERKDWRWEHWRLDESIEALRVIARRYKGHPAVSGIAVCNEPSEKVPADVLGQFYDEAVRTIRTFMPPDEVSIVLPVYRTERLDEIWRLWNRVFDGFASHANVAFDLHLYHCFGAWWQRQGLGSHLRMAKRHRKILRRVPAGTCPDRHRRGAGSGLQSLCGRTTGCLQPRIPWLVFLELVRLSSPPSRLGCSHVLSASLVGSGRSVQERSSADSCWKCLKSTWGIASTEFRLSREHRTSKTTSRQHACRDMAYCTVPPTMQYSVNVDPSQMMHQQAQLSSPLWATSPNDVPQPAQSPGGPMLLLMPPLPVQQMGQAMSPMSPISPSAMSAMSPMSPNPLSPTALSPMSPVEFYPGSPSAMRNYHRSNSGATASDGPCSPLNTSNRSSKGPISKLQEFVQSSKAHPLPSSCAVLQWSHENRMAGSSLQFRATTSFLLDGVLGLRSGESLIVREVEPEGARGIVVRRVIEADNSCLFNAVGYVREKLRGEAPALRKIVAERIAADPERYCEAFLAKPNADYCDWILQANNWGGAIELSVLAEHFQCEPGQGYKSRYMLIYDGIHYDALALAAEKGSPEAADFTVFEVGPEADLADMKARSFVAEQNKQRQFTDTGNFTLRCCICQAGLKGEADARAHASSTGHQNFAEPHHVLGGWWPSKKQSQRDAAERALAFFIGVCGNELTKGHEGHAAGRKSPLAEGQREDEPDEVYELEDFVGEQLRWSCRWEAQDTQDPILEALCKATVEFQYLGVSHVFAGKACSSKVAAKTDTARRVLWYLHCPGYENAFEVEQDQVKTLAQAIPEPVPGTWPPTQEALNAACSPSTVASTCEQEMDLSPCSPSPLSPGQRSQAEQAELLERKTTVMRLQNRLQKIFAKQLTPGKSVWCWRYEKNEVDHTFQASVHISLLDRTFTGGWASTHQAAQMEACNRLTTFLDKDFKM
eukprot:s121_g37.t2